MSSTSDSGRRFGPYEIQSRLGGGGMGAVFRAWDARLHREVAIKLLHDEYAMPGMRERFLREARAASALNHPNICTIFDIGEQDGDPYLVMELLEGVTLRDRITGRGISTEEIICIGKEVAGALGAAHAKGVIHRDVKPANIFLVERPNGAMQAKMLDFGLAKIEGGVLGARHSRSMDLTTAGSTVGTLAYMSPEQARGETLDSRSDLFSLGVVLYEMATRHVPFPGATSALVFVKLLNQAPEPVRDWNEQVPRELEKIIFKLMAKERTARFQTAQEVVDALSQVSDKPNAGWLRKAVGTVPLVRSPDPSIKSKRSVEKRKENTGYDGPPPERLQERTPVPTAGPATPRPSSPGSEANQFLRPVARMPRGEQTPRPSSAAVPIPQNASSDPGVVASGAAPAQNTISAETSAAAALTAHNSTSTSPNPLSFSNSGAFVAPTAGENEVPERRRDSKRQRLIWWVVAGLVLALGGTWLLLHGNGHFGPTLLGDMDPLVVTEIDNRTGDKTLDGTAAVALQIALVQSPYLMLRSSTSYSIVKHQRVVEGQDPTGPVAARDLAKRLKTHAYLYGSLKNSTPPYILHIDLINTATGDILTSAEERASSIGELPAAIDRIADTLRTAIGEDSDSIAHTRNPLSREATTSIEALHAYSLAEAAGAEGHTLDALRFYQQAVALDPRFVQAQITLSMMYHRLRAGVAAADSAKLALAAADNSSERLRGIAQGQYEIEVSGDYVRAAAVLRQTIGGLPHDAQLLELLGRSLRLQGRMTESLQSLQQAIEEDPYELEAYTEAEDALIGLDRYDAAYQMEGQVDKLGVARPGANLTAAYLENRVDAVNAARTAIESSKTGFRPDWPYGIYLDNTGRLQEGETLWRDRANQAAQVKELASASATLLSQGGLDQALTGDCTGGLQLARQADDLPESLAALFNSGMTHALCGSTERANQIVDTMHKQYPQSFAVAGFYVPDIKAALALHDNDPVTALEVLKPARQFDLISLTPYLRGLAHVALRQVQIGIVDFQTVLAHRGMTFLVGNTVYPMAEIGVARAFADTGDTGNSADAYRHFLDLWHDADPGPLVTEARAHIK